MSADDGESHQQEAVCEEVHNGVILVGDHHDAEQDVVAVQVLVEVVQERCCKQSELQKKGKVHKHVKFLPYSNKYACQQDSKDANVNEDVEAHVVVEVEVDVEVVLDVAVEVEDPSIRSEADLSQGFLSASEYASITAQ